jgi:hypothetical protein
MSIEFITREHIAKMSNLSNREKKDLEEIADSFQVLINRPNFNPKEWWEQTKKEQEELMKKKE